jgi:L-arabinose transport system substrate-binding protein
MIGVGIGGVDSRVEFGKEKPTGFFGTIMLQPRRHGYETAELMYKWIKDGVEPPPATLTVGIVTTRENYEVAMREQGL